MCINSLMLFSYCIKAEKKGIILGLDFIPFRHPGESRDLTVIASEKSL